MTEYRHVARPAAQADELASAGPDYTPREAALIAKIRELEDARIALLLENKRLQFKYNEIKLEARIIGVTDSIVAVAYEHHHQSDLGIAAALAEVEKYRGKLYDPAIVDAALRLFREKGFSIF